MINPCHGCGTTPRHTKVTIGIYTTWTLNCAQPGCPAPYFVTDSPTERGATQRWNHRNPADRHKPNHVELQPAARCPVCHLAEPHVCLAGESMSRRGESVIHDGRRWA